MYPYPPPPRARDSGATTVVVVLLWVFVGWPVSWFLLLLFFPLGLLFGVAITVGMIVYLVTSSGRPPVRPVVVPPMVPAARPGVPSRYQEVRREVEGLAHVNAVGGCGWCGSSSAHRTDEGYTVAPRHWHASEIEERVRAKLGF